jgi:cytochrome P450
MGAKFLLYANSDTTASTLTYIFHHLAKDTTQQDKLRRELMPLREQDGDFLFKPLQTAGHLNGVINEALRLHPAVPSGVLRLTPPEGIKIGSTFIPGNTTVVTPSYTIGRRELFSIIGRPPWFHT